MNWFTNFSLVIRSNVMSLCERFENPERMLDQLIIDMEEELERVRANVAGVIADEIQLGRKVENARAEAVQWDQRAIAALQRSDEPAARAATKQKVLAGERAETMDAEYEKHKQETGRLHGAIRDLERQIRQARHKRSLLLARLARVESARKINQVMSQTDASGSLAQFGRLEERVERAEALEQAYVRLGDRDPVAEDLAAQFAEREQSERVEKEFEELKRRVEPND